MPNINDELRTWIEQFANGEHDIADLLCQRHAGDSTRLALRYQDADGNEETLTYGELADLSARFATRLAAAGVGRGDRVATLLPKCPEIVIAAVGLWRLGAVHVPLFTAFGPDAIGFRLDDADARVVITDTRNSGKLRDATRAEILLVDDLREQLGCFEPVASATQLGADELLILIYTSGTTGQPKGVEVPVRALASFLAYLRLGLDVRDDDTHWNVGDPGWAYGLYYGLVGSLLIGQTILYYNGPFSADAAYAFLAKYQVTNLAAAPTVYRALRASGSRPAGLRLRACSSAGEPLNPDVIAWGERELGVPIRDQYGQTELGMVALNSQRHDPAEVIKPGSMGRAMTGFRVVVVDAEGHELGPGATGEVAIDVPRSPQYWFRGYWRAPEWTARRFLDDGRLFLTGDAASMDADGYVFFSSRADDIINSAGHRIGPFEVESCLIAHPAVAEVAVIGVPDDMRGETVKAYVVLKTGKAASTALAGELGDWVRSRLSAHAYPRMVEFVDQLPKTPSGKVQRYMLRKEIHGMTERFAIASVGASAAIDAMPVGDSSAVD
jgi:acetyl-CoA synthetase